MERFWAKVDFGGDCWEWMGAASSNGYGNFYLGGGRGEPRYIRAHRMAWRLLVGPLPNDVHLDHRCLNLRCVNPDHVEPVSASTNLWRRWLSKRTHCPQGHPMTSANTYVTARGGRQCKACRAESERRRRVRLKGGDE